jgi:hypothetical protein
MERRKLLVAAIGVATATYAACSTYTTSGNLVAPPIEDTGTGDAKDAAPDTTDASGDATDGG